MKRMNRNKTNKKYKNKIINKITKTNKKKHE